MKTYLATALAAVFVAALAGCSSGTPSSTSAPRLADTELKAILVKKLSSDCTDLNAYVLSPTNWESQGPSPTGVGTEFVLPGDGGALAMDVLPDGVGGANVVIADLYVDVTNINLYNSGCRTLATAPADTVNSPDVPVESEGSDSSSQTSSNSGTQNPNNNQPASHYEQTCTRVWVSNHDPNQNGTSSIGSWADQCQQVWVQ